MARYRFGLKKVSLTGCKVPPAIKAIAMADVESGFATSVSAWAEMAAYCFAKQRDPQAYEDARKEIGERALP